MMAITYMKRYVVAAGLVLVGTIILATTAAPQVVSAQNYTPKKDLCGGADLKLDQGDCSPNGENPSTKLNDLIATIVNVLSILVGVLAVIMIIWGGFKFIASGGDSNQVASARQTILYAIVGLLIVAFAQVFVRFILDRVA